MSPGTKVVGRRRSLAAGWLGAVVGLALVAFGCGQSSGGSAAEPAAEYWTDLSIGHLVDVIAPPGSVETYVSESELVVAGKIVEFTAGRRAETSPTEPELDVLSGLVKFRVERMLKGSQSDELPYVYFELPLLTGSVDQAKRVIETMNEHLPSPTTVVFLVSRGNDLATAVGTPPDATYHLNNVFGLIAVGRRGTLASVLMESRLDDPSPDVTALERDLARFPTLDALQSYVTRVGASPAGEG